MKLSQLADLVDDLDIFAFLWIEVVDEPSVVPILDVAIPLSVAMLGGEIQVPTFKGKLALKIPPETQNGRVFRLAGQGMPHLGNSFRGDMLARVNVTLPTRLSAEEKQLFRRLGELRPA